MKKKRKKAKMIIVWLILIVAFLFIRQALQMPTMETKQVTTPVIPIDPYENVKKYSTEIHAELAKYGLEEHTVTLAALMQQESRGKGGDPMQASESKGLAPNAITDPTESIAAGVLHFKKIMEYGKQKNVDFETIIQSYNMGIGYINFIANAGGKHTEELAKQFSMVQVEKNPVLYDCGGNKDNFRYPYCYGDFSYTAKVSSNIDALADSIATLVDQEQPGEAF